MAFKLDQEKQRGRAEISGIKKLMKVPIAKGMRWGKESELDLGASPSEKHNEGERRFFPEENCEAKKSIRALKTLGAVCKTAWGLEKELKTRG